MPKRLKQLDREAYCSAPPLPTSSLRPLRITRKAEARRPCAPIIECKAEVSSIESLKFTADEDFDMKPAVKVELDPRQLRAGIAALAIRPPSPGSSEASEAAAPGPSGRADSGTPASQKAA